MRIGIVCKVIDNFGDAGFALRLGKALARFGHSTFLFHDHAASFDALYPEKNCFNLTLIDAAHLKNTDFCNYAPLDLLIEPFGTSSEGTKNRFDLILKKIFFHSPWLLVDYLSAEDWVQDFHLTRSINPVSQHVSTYFYPGFTHRTGGLIHCDYPKHLLESKQMDECHFSKVFVFAYACAPLKELATSSEKLNRTNWRIELNVAGGWDSSLEQFACVKKLTFCPQDKFDDLLARQDVLFVRGEDSFVRAQLAAKPFIWQIYPTQDNSHAGKLLNFFNRYANNLDTKPKLALWNCWVAWNQLAGAPGFAESWTALQIYLPQLRLHAQKWRKQLLSGPELVREILTWRNGQTPLLTE